MIIIMATINWAPTVFIQQIHCHVPDMKNIVEEKQILCSRVIPFLDALYIYFESSLQ